MIKSPIGIAAFLAVVIAIVAVMAYYGFRPGILLNRRIDLTCARMLLKKARLTDSIWDAQRSAGHQFGVVSFTSPWVAQGERGGIRVQVQFYPGVGEYGEESATSVLLIWPRPVSTGALLDRIMSLGDSSKGPIRTIPFVKTSPFNPYRHIDHPWFGRSYAMGTDAEIERVFNPQIRAKLDAFPRRLAIVQVMDHAMTIEWFGQEDDLGIIEQAFKIGIDCLETLAPRK